MIFSLCEPHTKYFNSMDSHAMSLSLSLWPHFSFVLYSQSLNWPHKICIPINFYYILYIYSRCRSLHLHLVSAILCFCPLFRLDVTMPDINLCTFCCCQCRINCLQFDNSLPGAVPAWQLGHPAVRAGIEKRSRVEI